MKQTKNEITRETAPEYPDLDQALEQLAGEVPPMPSGLHEKWMNAVKTEAAKREEPETETGEKETAGKNRTGSMVRLTRYFGIAAAFVFLIGGTLLYRSGKGSLSAKDQAAPVIMDEAAVPETEIQENGAAVNTVSEPELSVQAAEYAEETAEYAEEAADYAEEAGEALASGTAAVNSAAAKAYGAVKNAAEERAAEPEGAAPDLSAFEAEYEEAEMTEPEAAEDAVSAETIPEVKAAGTAEPMATQMPTPEPVQAEEELKAGEKADGFLQQAGAFFTDMGEFLLAALPYLLGAAALAAALVIARKTKAGK